MIKIKIIELDYSKQKLEEYINKTGYNFLGFTGGKMIFKHTEKTKREIKAKSNTEKFFELNEEGIDNYAKAISERLELDFEFTKQEILKFIDYRTEKSEGAIKCKWQKQSSFEVPLRLKTWFNNNKNKKPVSLEINMI